MHVFTKTQYYSAYDKAPGSIKDILFSEETSQAIQKIVLRHNLDAKTMEISARIGYVLVGLIPVKKFIQALEEDAGLDAETAKNLAHDVRAEIFAPVAEELAALQAEAEKNYEEAQKHETYSIKHETKETQTSLDDDSRQNKEPLSAANNKGNDNSSNPPAPANKPAQDSNPKETPQIEYVPKKKEGEEAKPDESVAREHPGYPFVEEKKVEPPAQKEEPKSEETVKLKTEEETPKQEPKEDTEPPKKNISAPNNDNNIKNEIFPPAPPANLPGADTNSKKPLSELEGKQNNEPTENKEQGRAYPPIPDTHRVDLRNNNNS